MQATALSRKVIKVPNNQITCNNLLQQVNIQLQKKQQKWNKRMQTCSVYNKNYARSNSINKITNIANKALPTNVCVHDNQHVPSLQSVGAKVFYTLSSRIGKVGASHTAVACSSPAEVALIYTMHVALRGYCPWGWGVRPVNWIYRLWCHCQ